MKQSFIVVTEIPENVLLEGLKDFANQYPTQFSENTIVLYREKKVENFLILFTDILDFDHFCFAVNYIRYIKSPNNKLPLVFGYYLNSSGSKNPSFLTDGFVKTYVSKNDQEYDNVSVVNKNNETFLYDFGGRISKLPLIEEAFEVPSFDINNYNHILEVIPGSSVNKPWWKIW